MAPQIKSRQLPGDQVRDPSIVDLLQYNEKAGARKSVTVGAAFLPLGDGAGGYTTNATTAPRVLPSAGCQIAVYNNSTTAYAVTVGDNTMTAQAIGAVQVSGSNVFVGVPCEPNSWTYISSAQWNYVATNNASLIVFLVDDPTFIQAQPAANASANNIQLGTPGIANTAPSGAPVNEPNT